MTSDTDAPGSSERGRVSTSLVVAALLAFAFLGGAVAGFAVRHDPQPEVVSVRLEGGEPSNAGETLIRGSITAVMPGNIDVTDEGGPRRVPLPAGVPVEELTAMGSEAPREGAPANVGGTRTENGWVLGGVVLLPEGASGGPR